MSGIKIFVVPNYLGCVIEATPTKGNQVYLCFIVVLYSYITFVFSKICIMQQLYTCNSILHFTDYIYNNWIGTIGIGSFRYRINWISLQLKNTYWYISTLCCILVVLHA